MLASEHQIEDMKHSQRCAGANDRHVRRCSRPTSCGCRLLYVIVTQKILFAIFPSCSNPADIYNGMNSTILGIYIRTSDSSLHTPALHEMREMSCSQGKHDWTLRLPEFFAKEGLLDTTVYPFEDLPSFTRAKWRAAFVEDGRVRFQSCRDGPRRGGDKDSQTLARCET